MRVALERLDRLINRLIEARNVVTANHTTDFDFEHELASTEVAVEALYDEIKSEENDL